MKIFTIEQLREADKVTVEKQGITAVELMERAATRAFEELMKNLKRHKTIHVFCGVGNNGADGLVISRNLLQHGYKVKVHIVNYTENHSEGFEVMMTRLKKVIKTEVAWLNDGDQFPEVGKKDTIVDAIFGIGLNRPLPAWVNDLVAHLNTAHSDAFAIDMPTGMFSDRILGDDQNIMKVDATMTFQRPKLVFYLAQTAEYVGRIKAIDIGLDKCHLKKTQTAVHLIGRNKLFRIRQPRERFSHKGTYGHSLIIGGSYGMMGSVVLASKAGLRVGAGKVTALVPTCGYNIMQTSVPEVMVMTSSEEKRLSDFEKLSFTPETICFGVGAGTDDKTAAFFEQLLHATDRPMVIDADGLNLLAAHKEWLKLVPKNSILTPHPMELKRLIGEWKDDFDKLRKTDEFAKKYKLIVVMKDAISMTVSHDRIFINSSGNPGMATAGSGDVLSGVIAGLLAQGYEPENAAVFGVYLHGSAGDLALKESSLEALIAGDLVKHFGAAFERLNRILAQD